MPQPHWKDNLERIEHLEDIVTALAEALDDTLDIRMKLGQHIGTKKLRAWRLKIKAWLNRS